MLYQHLWRAWSEHSDQADPGVDWDAIQHYLTSDVESAARSAAYTDEQHDRMLLLHFAVALSPPVPVVLKIIDLNPRAVVAGITAAPTATRAGSRARPWRACPGRRIAEPAA